MCLRGCGEGACKLKWVEGLARRSCLLAACRAGGELARAARAIGRQAGWSSPGRARWSLPALMVTLAFKFKYFYGLQYPRSLSVSRNCWMPGTVGLPMAPLCQGGICGLCSIILLQGMTFPRHLRLCCCYLLQGLPPMWRGCRCTGTGVMRWWMPLGTWR